MPYLDEGLEYKIARVGLETDMWQWIYLKCKVLCYLGRNNEVVETLALYVESDTARVIFSLDESQEKILKYLSYLAKHGPRLDPFAPYPNLKDIIVTDEKN